LNRETPPIRNLFLESTIGFRAAPGRIKLFEAPVNSTGPCIGLSSTGVENRPDHLCPRRLRLRQAVARQRPQTHSRQGLIPNKAKLWRICDIGPPTNYTRFIIR